MTDLEKPIEQRLKATSADIADWNGHCMTTWDKIRGLVIERPGSDLPRMCFEGLVEDYADLMSEAAQEIERLRMNR